jgi:hypothetical protein
LHIDEGAAKIAFNGIAYWCTGVMEVHAIAYKLTFAITTNIMLESPQNSKGIATICLMIPHCKLQN